jgi:hypothetical protein
MHPSRRLLFSGTPGEDEDDWFGATVFVDRQEQLVADCMRCLRMELAPTSKEQGLPNLPLPIPRYLEQTQMSMSSSKLPPLIPPPSEQERSKASPSLQPLLQETECGEAAVRMWCLQHTPEASFFNRTNQYRENGATLLPVRRLVTSIASVQVQAGCSFKQIETYVDSHTVPSSGPDHAAEHTHCQVTGSDLAQVHSYRRSGAYWCIAPIQGE